MHRNILLFALSCVFVALAAHAAETGPECAAKLASGDRFYGAIYARTQSGQLTLDQLRQLVHSPEPINPLAHETPGSHNASAIRTFEALKSDPEVIAHWPSTREAIKALVATRFGIELERQHAAKATSEVVAPQLFAEIPDEAISSSLTELQDGRLVYAHAIGNTIYVSEVAHHKGGSIESYPVPEEGLHRLSRLLLKWHTDQSGAKWLYLSATAKDKSITAYRLKFGDKKFTRIADDGLNGGERESVRYLESVAPGFMTSVNHNFGTRDIYYQLDSGRFEPFNEADAYQRMISANIPSGVNIKPVRSSFLRNATVYYRDQHGTLYWANANAPNTLAVGTLTHDPIQKSLFLPGQTGNEDLKFFEDNGQLYIAVVSNRGGGIIVFKPLESDSPILRVPFDVSSTPELHWFHSPEGRLLFVGTAGGLSNATAKIVDVHSSSSPIDFATNGFVREYFTSGKQTYFLTHNEERNITEIYSVFNSPKK